MKKMKNFWHFSVGDVLYSFFSCEDTLFLYQLGIDSSLFNNLVWKHKFSEDIIRFDCLYESCFLLSIGMASKVELWKLDINNYDNLVMMGSRNCIEGYFFIFQSHISSLYIFGPSEIDILRWNSSSTPGTIEKYYLNNGLGKLASSIDSNPKRLVEHVFVMHSDSPSFILVLQSKKLVSGSLFMP